MPVVGIGAVLVADCHRDALRREGMGVRRPDLAVGVDARSGVHRQLHHVVDLDRSLSSVLVPADRGASYAEHLSDQGCEVRHHTSGRAGEDRLQRFALSVICLVVDVEGDLPVPLGHRARRPRDQGDIQPVQRDLPEAAVIDVEAEGDLARALGRCRGHRLAGREQAGANDIAVAVLEVLAANLPSRLSCSHCEPPLRVKGWRRSLRRVIHSDKAAVPGP